MRALILLVVVAMWLSLATAVAADDESDPESAPPSEQEAPAGPTLQPSDAAPVICDPDAHGFRYVEVRGSGFDAWATQRLVGNLLDSNGVARAQWGSVWVSPRGGLTLEVNLCADPFRGRPALAAGTYTVSIGQGAGAPVAATSIDVSPPPEPPAEDDVPAEEAVPSPAPTANAGAAPTAAPFVLPNVVSVPAPTPAPVSIAEPAPTPPPGPRVGPGSREQPFPLGAPGTLADGWQLVVTGVTADAWSGIHSDIPSASPPASDQRDFMVRVQATFQGQGTGAFTATRLALISSIQTSYDQLHNSCGVVPDMVPPNLVTAGGEVRGNVCFTVRASDVDSLILFDNQANDSDRLYFSLR